MLGFGDEISAFLIEEARPLAEDIFTDTCRITRPGEGQGPFNPETGQYDAPPPIVVYEGPCRLNVPGQIANASTATAGEASWTVQDSVLSIPVDGDGYTAGESVRSGHTVEYLTAPHDPTLVGRRFGVVGQHSESQATARRLRIKEVTG